MDILKDISKTVNTISSKAGLGNIIQFNMGFYGSKNYPMPEAMLKSLQVFSQKYMVLEAWGYGFVNYERSKSWGSRSRYNDRNGFFWAVNSDPQNYWHYGTGFDLNELGKHIRDGDSMQATIWGIQNNPMFEKFFSSKVQNSKAIIEIAKTFEITTRNGAII